MKVSCFAVFTLLPYAASFSTAPTRSRITQQRTTTLEMASSPSNGDDGDDTSSSSGRRSFLEKAAGSGFAVATTALFTALPVVQLSNAADVVVKTGGPIQFGDESIMTQKGHGTSAQAVQEDLMYGVDRKLADKIVNYNRHFAEMGGSYKNTNWEDVVLSANNGQPVTFYDSVTGKPLFVAPIGRSAEDLLRESEVHGWPSFRDSEVVWENVRVLRSSGETVSVDGSHLGHNLPDKTGNRYCINLVSIAGKPTTTA